MGTEYSAEQRARATGGQPIVTAAGLPPNGCSLCGVPLPHGQQWMPPAGWHTWVRPTDDQILARMQARRAARITDSLKDGPMSDTPSALATIAALHTLLTERPELTELPIRWQVEQDGSLHVGPRYCVEGSHATVRALAAALDFETHEYTVTDRETGEVKAVVSAVFDARFAGAQVYSTGYELAETAAEGGAL